MGGISLHLRLVATARISGGSEAGEAPDLGHGEHIGDIESA